MPCDFLLDVPSGYDPARAYALVLAFRGVDQSAAEFSTARLGAAPGRIVSSWRATYF
jgi:hypothetical protein